MNKVKKMLIAILFILITLYAVELVDWQIHKATYIKIDDFFKTNKQVAKGQDAKSCFNQSMYIYKNTIFKLTNDKDKISNEFKNPKIYLSTISSCNNAVDDFKNIYIPSDIPKNKNKLLKDYNQANIQSIKININNLNILKKCNGNEQCVIKAENIIEYNPYKESKLLLMTLLTAIQAKERLSVSYILRGYAGEYFIKNKIKKLENNESEAQNGKQKNI